MCFFGSKIRSFFVLLFVIHSLGYATKVTIDAEAGADYVSINAFLQYYNNSSATMPDTVLFKHADIDTFLMTNYIGNRAPSGGVLFIGECNNPDSFPVISHTGSEDYYNFFLGNITFEKIRFTGSTAFRSAATAKTLTFRRCVIANYSAYFINFENSSSVQNLFENCLFVNNTGTNGVIYLNSYPGKKIGFINCSFDNNTKIFGAAANTVDSFIVFQNSLFSGNGAYFSSDKMKSNATYCLTSDNSLTGYGTGCVSGAPQYVVATGRTKPSDWKIPQKSPAAKVGISTSAPPVDIGGRTRTTPCDIGCWMPDVPAKPVITDQPDTVIVNEDSTVTFSVVVTGVELEYSWYASGSTTKLSDSSKLIVKAAFSDSGTKYFCVVSNGGGPDSSKIAVMNVYKKPAITKDITDTTVTVNDILELYVSATGTRLSFQWYRNNEVMSGANNDTIVFNGVTLNDNNDTFFCVVKNPLGASVTSKNCILTVKDTEKAKIKNEPPENVIVTMGDAFSFSTEATGSGIISYTWYKNGLTSNDSTGSGETFSKTSAVLADSGIYYCVVNNGYGTDTTRAVSVKVLDPSQIRCRIQLKGTFIDCEHVKISFSNLKTVTSVLPNPNVDSIGLQYDTVSVLKNVTQIAIPLLRFQKDQDTFDTTINVRDLSENCYKNYFIPVMFWKSPDTVHIGQLTNDGTVSMCSQEKLENPIKIACSYTPLSDEVKASFTNIPEGNARDNLKYLIVRYGNDAFGFVNDTIMVNRLPAGATYEKVYKNGDFLNDPQTLTFDVRVRGVLKNVSDAFSTTVQVGIARPVNNIASLTVKDASPPFAHLEWTMSSTESVDSIRIWTGKIQIPLKYNPDPQTYTSTIVGGKERTCSVNKIEPGVLYYFAAQIKKNDLWSSITVDSRTFKQMPDLDTQQVKNTIKIKKIGFDSTKNILAVQWSIDSAGLGKTELQAAICFSVDSFPVNGPGEKDTLIGTINFSMDNISNILWKDGKLFDTTYYVSMFLRSKNAKWSFASSDAQMSIKISKSQWESITFFNKEEDSVYALNRSVVILKGKNWDANSILSHDEILSDTFPANVDGFIKISTPFRFKNAEQSSDIGIGARYSVIPEGFSAQDINLYEYKNNNWYAVERVSIDLDSKLVFVNFPMGNASNRKNLHVLMIDTVVPVVEYNDDNSAIEPNESFMNPIKIKDNIANVVCTLKCGMIDKAPAVVKIIPLSDTVYSGFLSISNSTVAIKSENSFRILLTVDDYHFKKTYDFSRQVKQDKNPETVYDDKWVPVSTQSVLNDPSIERAFLGICEGGEWKYDSTKFRIFNWYSGTQSKYIQYSNDKPDIFKVVPGRVFWLKKRGDAMFDLGSGKTVSIKEPFKIQLPAKQWTDFCMPYKISLSLADIFRSSNLSKEIQDSIWFFEFQSSKSLKTPGFSTVYYPVLGTNQSKKETVLKYTDDNAYTIYNATGNDVELTIPPVDISYSTASDDGLQKKLQNDVWHIEIASKTINDITSPAYCVFKSNGKGATWLPSPPYPGSVRVGLLNSSTNITYGTMVFNEEQPGYSIPLYFSNSSKSESKTITYTFNSSKPENMGKIALYNVETGKLEPVSSNLSLTLGPQEHAYRWALVGDSSYYNSWISNFANVQFGLLKISEISGHLLGIEYTVPYFGVSAVKVMVINQLGQCVWSTVNRHLVPGKRNVTNWNTRKANKLATGAYIIQISSYNTMHKQTQRIQKRYLHFSR